MSKDNSKNADNANLDKEVNNDLDSNQQQATLSETGSEGLVKDADNAKVKDSTKEKTYIVAYGFIDKNDRHSYAPGDVFPFDGRKIDGKRIAELSSMKNDTKVVLIKEQ